MGEEGGAAADGVVGGGGCVQFDPVRVNASDDRADWDDRSHLYSSGGLRHIDGIPNCDVPRCSNAVPFGDQIAISRP